MRLSVFFLQNFAFFLTLAIASTGKAQTSVKFYKSPMSLFSSGETNPKELEKTKTKNHFEFSYLVQNGPNKKYWTRAESLATDINVSQFATSSKTKKIYKLIRNSGSQWLGESTDFKVQEWLSIQELTPVTDDLGNILTLTSTSIRSEPNWKSDSVIQVPAKTSLAIKRFEDTWALVQFESIGQMTGWIDLSNVITKYDFASFVLVDKKWLPVNYREGNRMISIEKSGSKKEIPLDKISALMTKPDLAISLVADDSQNLLLRQNLQILKTQAEAWNLSQLSGHGEVYWKNSTSSNRLNLSPNDDSTLTTEQILKREVTSTSFHPKNPNMGLAASQGIYLTTDGKIWNKLHQFKNQSFAVLIDDHGVFYVGNQRSFDGGKTFQPFLKWESLAHMIEQKQKKPAAKIHIASLSLPRAGILQMDIETDLGKLRVAAKNTYDAVTKWDFF